MTRETTNFVIESCLKRVKASIDGFAGVNFIPAKIKFRKT
jgi:hypothetical protein